MSAKITLKFILKEQRLKLTLLFLLIFLFLSLFCTLLPVGSAAETAVLKVGHAEARPGESVNITLTLENNPGIAGLLIEIGYDSSRLRLDLDGTNAVTRGTALSNLTYVGLTGVTAAHNPFTVLWYSAKNDSGNGVILNVRFIVLNDAPAGEAAITVTSEPKDAVSESGKLVALSVQNAAVTVIRDSNFNIPSDIPVKSDESKAAEKIEEVEVIEVDSSCLPQNVNKAADDNTVFTIYSTYANITNITENISAASVPYENNGGGISENLTVYHIDNSGAITPVATSKYDEKNGMMKFCGEPGKFYIIAPNKVSFSDVTEKDWFFEAVSFVTSRRLFEGVGGTQFAPSSTMTRAMFITVLARLDGADLSQYKTPPYSDTEINTWYGPAVAWAAQTGIIDDGILSGCQSGTFKPNDNITREQMAVIFANYIRMKKLSLKKIETHDFADTEQASDWAKQPINSMRSYSIINGVGGNFYNPKGTATRAEVAQIFTNLINAIIGI